MIGRILITAGSVAALAAPAAAAPTTAIATVGKGDVRAVVTARKTSGGLAPTAAVTVVGYRHAGGAWKKTGTHPITGTFFWKTVTAPHGLCRLELTGSSLTLSVRVTPSIGCAPTRTIRLAS